jgi:AcrR family transcriptional regulator
MTVGNLYRYYKNKEDLFGAIIGDLYKKLRGIKTSMPEKSEDRLDWLLNQFKELQREFRNEWLILFGGSSGTKYEKTADDIHSLLRNTLKDVLEKHDRRPEIAAPVASAIIYGLNTILKTEKRNSADLAEDFLNYMMVDITSRVA